VLDEVEAVGEVLLAQARLVALFGGDQEVPGDLVGLVLGALALDDKAVVHEHGAVVAVDDFRRGRCAGRGCWRGWRYAGGGRRLGGGGRGGWSRWTTRRRGRGWGRGGRCGAATRLGRRWGRGRCGLRR